MSKADPIDRFEFPDVPACGTAIRFHRGDDWVLDGYRPADGDFATQLVWLEKSTEIGRAHV